jgi:hypothetical protein
MVVMPVKEIGEYYVGRRGWIDVLDSPGHQRRWVWGEIISLIPTSKNTLWAMIKTHTGTRVCQLW